MFRATILRVAKFLHAPAAANPLAIGQSDPCKDGRRRRHRPRQKRGSDGRGDHPHQSGYCEQMYQVLFRDRSVEACRRRWRQASPLHAPGVRQSPLGTQFITSNPNAGLDWPLRLLLTQDDNGDVWAVWTDFEWIAKRHHITDRAAQFEMATMVVNSITSTITSK